MHGVDRMSVAARDPAQPRVCSANMREFHLVLPPLRCRCLSPCPCCLRCTRVPAVVPGVVVSYEAGVIDIEESVHLLVEWVED